MDNQTEDAMEPIINDRDATVVAELIFDDRDATDATELIIDDRDATDATELIIDDRDATDTAEFITENEKECRVTRPSRKIIIEPILIMMALFGLPMSLLSHQYIYQKISKDLAFKECINNTSVDNNLSNCKMNKSDELYIFRQEVQQASTYFQIYMTISTSIPAIFVTLFIGAYSDKAGRKLALIAPAAGSLIRAASYVLVIYLDLPKWYLLIGSVLDGFTGHFVTMLMACFSYIADITDPEDRMFRITVMEMSMFLSALLTPIGIGYWIKSMGYLYPFLMVLGGLLINLVYVIFFVPETIRKDPTVRFFDCSHLSKTVALFTKKDRKSNRRWKLCLVLTSFSLVMVAMGESVNTLFEMNEPLCWLSVMIGYYTAAHIAIATVGGITSAKILKCFVSDPTIALIAGIAGIGSYVSRGFVINTTMMFCTSIFSVLSVLFTPTIRAIMSQLVNEDEQGAMFGSIACVESVCGLVGSLLSSSIYAQTLAFRTSFVYFAMALFYMAGVAILLVYVLKLRKEQKKLYSLLVEEPDADFRSTESIN